MLRDRNLMLHTFSYPRKQYSQALTQGMTPRSPKAHRYTSRQRQRRFSSVLKSVTRAVQYLFTVVPFLCITKCKSTSKPVALQNHSSMVGYLQAHGWYPTMLHRFCKMDAMPHYFYHRTESVSRMLQISGNCRSPRSITQRNTLHNPKVSILLAR